MTNCYMPVIFRAERYGPFKGDVTAVFPTQEEYPRLGVYQHIGQHGSGDIGWYLSTRPAKPNEYEPLLLELKEIYEGDDDPVRLKIYKRISSAMRKREAMT